MTTSMIIPAKATITAKEFDLLRELIYGLSGIKLADHKQMLVQCRLQKRVQALELDSFAEYHRYLVECDHDDREKANLLNAISTNTTHFFRENESFEFLRTQTFAEFSAPMRILSAGCSTGEEVYTTAIVANEHFGPDAQRHVHIDACDLNTEVLRKAQRGIFSLDRAMADIPREILHRYFLKGAPPEHTGEVLASSKLKRMISFFRQNLMEPLKVKRRYHVVFCRNVTIYFDRETQAGLFQRLLDVLVPGGYLIVGQSESMVFFNLPITLVEPAVYRKNLI